MFWRPPLEAPPLPTFGLVHCLSFMDSRGGGGRSGATLWWTSAQVQTFSVPCWLDMFVLEGKGREPRRSVEVSGPAEVLMETPQPSEECGNMTGTTILHRTSQNTQMWSPRCVLWPKNHPEASPNRRERPNVGDSVPSECSFACPSPDDGGQGWTVSAGGGANVPQAPQSCLHTGAISSCTVCIGGSVLAIRLCSAGSDGWSARRGRSPHTHSGIWIFGISRNDWTDTPGWLHVITSPGRVKQPWNKREDQKFYTYLDFTLPSCFYFLWWWWWCWIQLNNQGNCWPGNQLYSKQTQLNFWIILNMLNFNFHQIRPLTRVYLMQVGNK